MVDVGIEQHTGEPNGALTTVDSAQRAAERVVSKNTNGLKTVAPGRFTSVRRKRPWS